MKKLFSILFMFLLSGCAMIQEYQQVTLPTPTINATDVARIVQTDVARATQTYEANPRTNKTPAPTQAALPASTQTSASPPQRTPTPLQSNSPLPQSTSISGGYPAGNQGTGNGSEDSSANQAQTCFYSPKTDADQPLPDPNSLKWTIKSGAAGRWRVLEAFFSPVVNAQPDGGGRWWAVQVIRRGLAGSLPDTALYVLDGAGKGSWLASKTGSSMLNQFAWMEDGRFLWVDDGSVYVANADGSQKTNLNAPDAIREIWAGKSGLALASGANGLLRVNTKTLTWRPVNELFGVRDFSSPTANISLSPDGSFAALIASNPLTPGGAELWKIPLDPSQVAQRITQINYLGRGGRLLPPQPLANSSLWFVPDLSQDPLQPGVDVSKFVNIQEKKALPKSGLVPDDQSMSQAQVSPDGEWAAFLTSPKTQSPADGKFSVSFASSSDLKPFVTVDGDSVLTWRLVPPTAWVIHFNGPNQQEVTQVSLTDGKSQSLGTYQEQTWPPVIINVVSSTVVIAQKEAQVFDSDGKSSGSFPPPVPFSQINSAHGSPTGEVFLSGIQSSQVNGQCQYTFPIVLWALP